MPFAKFRLNVMQVFGMLYYESAILLGLINNTLEKTKWICKSEHYLFRVHGKTKWNFHGFFSFENVTKILLLHGTIKTAL